MAVMEHFKSQNLESILQNMKEYIEREYQIKSEWNLTFYIRIWKNYTNYSLSLSQFSF